MHEEGPEMQTREIQVPRFRPGLLVFSMLLLAMILFSTHAVAAQAQGGKPTAAKTLQAPPQPEDFVGQETCATCHEEVSKNFGANPHSALAERHGKAGVTCEGCHGPGKAHVEGGGDVTKIFNPAKATPKQVDENCLTCHQGNHANFQRTAHGEANVSCIGCHSIHTGEDKEQLLKVAQPNLCFQCHTDTKPQFNMPFHHKVQEGLVKCSDCHDPHGTFNKKNLRSSSQQDLVCTKCHMEKGGPFAYEHPVVKTEGCVACHFPHGGPNPRLLNRATVNTICLQCHSPSTNFSTSNPIGPAHNQATQYQSCTICHASVHGSNTSEFFFNATE